MFPPLYSNLTYLLMALERCCVSPALLTSPVAGRVAEIMFVLHPGRCYKGERRNNAADIHIQSLWRCDLDPTAYLHHCCCRWAAGTITGARLMHTPMCQDCPAGSQVQTAREFPQQLKGEMNRSIVVYLRISNKHTLLLISYINKKSLRLKSFRGFYCFHQCSLFCTCSVFNC